VDDSVIGEHLATRRGISRISLLETITGSGLLNAGL